ncbi:FlgO family outer membrane protein [Pseudoalteromonas sp. YIC-827]|uniref:FlgO family outer membrane protein n=1 Tax=Pseudoalteromonas qingdaonensis TaxID=3131913 RepID=A0ABU9MZF9_9GAMM
MRTWVFLAVSALSLSTLSGCAHHHHGDDHQTRDIYEGKQVTRVHHGHSVGHSSSHRSARTHHHHGYELTRLYTEGNVKTHASEPAQSSLPWTPPFSAYRPRSTHKLIGDYAEQLSMRLIENLNVNIASGRVAVASFVELDSSLKRTNLLGNQLAESMITELQEFGLQVVDFKATGDIRVTQQGDLAYSRDFAELAQHQAVDYILSGTLTYTDRGVIVNARIFGSKDRVVIASGKGFIPHFVVEGMYPASYRDGLGR